jgi:hypothetical protein
MWHDLGVALALVLVIEGILPFLNPAALRRMLLVIQGLSDREFRVAGFISMLGGLALLYFFNR